MSAGWFLFQHIRLSIDEPCRSLPPISCFTKDTIHIQSGCHMYLWAWLSLVRVGVGGKLRGVNQGGAYITLSILACYMLKYPLKCAPTEREYQQFSRYSTSNHCRTRLSRFIPPAYGWSTIYSIGEYLHWKPCFIEFGDYFHLQPAMVTFIIGYGTGRKRLFLASISE